MSDVQSMCLTPRSEADCWEITNGFTSSILDKKRLPSASSFTGTLATGIRSDSHTIAGEVIIWADDSTAKMTLHIKTPVKVFGSGNTDFTYDPKFKPALFEHQLDMTKKAMEYVATTPFPDKLAGKNGLKCKTTDTPTKKMAAMVTDKSNEKPKCMPVEYKVHVQGDQEPTKEDPLDGTFSLKYPLEVEAKGKLAASGDNLDPVDLPPCAAKAYLTENNLPLRQYKCYIGDQSVPITKLLHVSQMKPGGNAFGPFYGQISAQNTYMYSTQYNRIIHRPWVDKITLFAMPIRDGAGRDDPDVNMNSMLHLYAGNGKRPYEEVCSDTEPEE